MKDLVMPEQVALDRVGDTAVLIGCILAVLIVVNFGV